MRRRKTTNSIRFLCASVLLFALASAEAKGADWSLQARLWQDTQLENQDAPVERREYRAHYRWQGDYSLRAFYAHQPILIRNGEPAHNGYFHQLDIEASRTYGQTSIQLSGGIHGTSNMFKYGDFHEEAAVFTFAVSHAVEASNADLGISGDYRFGHFKLYPRIRKKYNLPQTGTVTVDLPVAATWQSANTKWSFGIESHGNKWAALDKQRQVDSAVYLREWRLSGGWDSNSGAYVEIGYSFHTQILYRDLFAGRREESLEDAFYLTVEFQTF